MYSSKHSRYKGLTSLSPPPSSQTRTHTHTHTHSWSICYAFIYGVTFGISQSIILFVYIVSFRFGAFLVTFPQGHVLYTEFQDIFRVFAAIIFASLGIGAAASFAPDYNQAKLSVKRVFSIINREPMIDNYSEEGAKPEQVNGEVLANEVYFAYPERLSVNVLSGLNLSVKSGKTLAIVGTSGSGKSTIFALLERFYDSHSGCVQLDGVDLLDLNVRWLREQIGFVPQEPDLLKGSIAENIRYGALFREVSDEEVIEAAKSANIHSFIESLPQVLTAYLSSSREAKTLLIIYFSVSCFYSILVGIQYRSRSKGRSVEWWTEAEGSHC